MNNISTRNIASLVTHVDLDKKHTKTNKENRAEASSKKNIVKNMIKDVNDSASQKINSKQAQKLADTDLEQKTSEMSTDLSGIESLERKITEKERELLRAIASGDYEKIKSLSSEIKSLVSELKSAASTTGDKYSSIQTPEVPNTSGAETQNANASAQATASAQKVASAQAQVNSRASSLSTSKNADSAESKAQQQAQEAVQKANVSKLASLKNVANADKKIATKTKEILSKAVDNKAAKAQEKSSKIEEQSRSQTDNKLKTSEPTQERKQVNPAQLKASNAYSKTQKNNDTKSNTISLKDVKDHPENYASSKVLKKYTETLNTAKSINGNDMKTYISLTEKVLAKADKALNIATDIKATDGSPESNSRLADAISNAGILDSSDVPQYVIKEHTMLAQEHRAEKAQKEMTEEAKDDAVEENPDGKKMTTKEKDQYKAKQKERRESNKQ